MLVEFYGLELELPSDWGDITDDLPPDSPPTLARPSGVGALQFSIAKYRSGETPDITLEALRDLMEDFCRRHSLDCEIEEDPSASVHAVRSISTMEDQVVSAWYLSNGTDVVLATYTCEELDFPLATEEMEEANHIIRSISF